MLIRMHFMQILSVTQCLEPDYSKRLIGASHNLLMQISLAHSIPKGNNGFAFTLKNISNRQKYRLNQHLTASALPWSELLYSARPENSQGFSSLRRASNCSIVSAC